MTTQKPKVFAYLSQALYGQVVQFKADQNLASDSKALIAILEAFFQSSESQSHGNDERHSNAIEHRLVALEINFARLSKQFENITRANGSYQSKSLAAANGMQKDADAAMSSIHELTSDEVVTAPANASVLSELPSELSIDEVVTAPASGSVPSELPSELPIDEVVTAPASGSVPSELLNELPTDKAATAPVSTKVFLSRTQLAKRLQVGYNTLKRHSLLPKAKFSEWVVAKDPDGLDWLVSPGAKHFRPALRKLPLENSFGEPVDPSLEYRHNRAKKGLAELQKKYSLSS